MTQTLDAPIVARTSRPLYPVLLGATVLLLVLGLAMVLSASTIVSYRTFGTPYVLFGRQVGFAVVGVLAMVVIAKTPIHVIRRFAYPLLGVTLVLLGMVLAVGVSVAGQRNWIELGGPFRLQPSEFAKLALVVWCADLLARKRPLLNQWPHVLIPIVPVSVIVMGLVLAEGDLGNVLVLIPMIAVALLVVGVPMRLFALGGVGVLGLIAVASLTKGYRLDRFRGWLDPESDPTLLGWQVLHGKSALGGGGWFGVGLGASREKWDWLPAAHTDFIYAVVGEELGVVGSLLVVALFASIIVGGLRVAMNTDDMFVRISAAMIVTWILAQTMLNLGGVLQLLPITGVPLPLVSYGGSSLVPTLAAAGLLLACARARPVDLRTG